MKEYKCPNCGAALKFNLTDNIVECEYCNTVVNLERSYGEISAEAAHNLAEKIKEYSDTKKKLEKAKSDLKKKSNEYSEILVEQKKTVPMVFLIFGVIWALLCVVFICLMEEWIYHFDIFRICLDISFAIASGYVFLLLSRKTRDKKVSEMNEKVQQAFLQKEYSEKCYAEIESTFDENFIPAEVRNEEAIKYIIKALETERAYTLRQAISQWKDRSELQARVMSAVNNSKNDSANHNKDCSKKDAEVIGAFTGAAVGALGGAVIKKTMKEVLKNI